MKITPEIIATEIFEWEYLPEYHWNVDDTISPCWIYKGEFGPVYRQDLPTFQESEWTGPLLEKALKVGYHYIMANGENGPIFELYIKGHQGGFCSRNKSLNLAIAGAILEAEGK
ncbi:hypothetical protein EHQ53_14150 [Leptospira langatensis]|uniref:Phage ABA sandwich domain-containing protein n=1 Tax=Leptospira langatensis TaxID=2484983 RepID=A0ABY2M9A2_9LEPT|nr:hypothetical protein [Leptospira langatensis]TGL39660.1 hypothetical protein EHQ53_14150 [Leptospira langatensis]